MSFTEPHPPENERSLDEPGVMHIGGPHGRRWRGITRWAAVVLIVAAMMIGLFIRFGATALWASGLVSFMLLYMALMGRWASRNHEQR